MQASASLRGLVGAFNRLSYIGTFQVAAKGGVEAQTF